MNGECGKGESEWKGEGSVAQLCGSLSLQMHSDEWIIEKGFFLIAFYE